MSDLQQQTTRPGRAVEGYLTSYRLQEIVAWHILPRLTLHDLARLACTCKVLRGTVNQQDQAWQAAATAQLPTPLHSQLLESNRGWVQRVMHRRSRALTQFRARGQVLDRTVFRLGMEDAARARPQLAFSYDGRLLAYCTSAHLGVLNVDSEEQVWDWLLKDLLAEVGLDLSPVPAFNIAWAFEPDYLTIFLHGQAQTAGSECHFLSLNATSGEASYGSGFQLDLSHGPTP
ncbi:hypothetical protein WJX73_009143 [Symbiochloris irregularis]|uniref:F-box domain-containing protein n=1 Tax=Symbiochloris irregularis TaxID=706552 RepID=A0AAW1NPS8_9CHLO